MRQVYVVIYYQRFIINMYIWRIVIGGSMGCCWFSRWLLASFVCIPVRHPLLFGFNHCADIVIRDIVIVLDSVLSSCIIIIISRNFLPALG